MPDALPDRRTIRLWGCAYRRRGWYFVTVVTHGRRRLLATVRNGAMMHTDAGQIVADEWARIPTHFPHVGVDAFVVMPDHIHGIIIITEHVGAKLASPAESSDRTAPDTLNVSVGAKLASPAESSDRPAPDTLNVSVGAKHASPAESSDHTAPDTTDRSPAPRGTIPGSIPAIVQGFKSGSTRLIRSTRPDIGHVWQRNYYERILRDGDALDAVRRYIADNPARWMARGGW